MGLLCFPFSASLLHPSPVLTLFAGGCKAPFVIWHFYTEVTAPSDEPALAPTASLGQPADLTALPSVIPAPRTPPSLWIAATIPLAPQKWHLFLKSLRGANIWVPPNTKPASPGALSLPHYPFPSPSLKYSCRSFSANGPDVIHQAAARDVSWKETCFKDWGQHQSSQCKLLLPCV